MTNTPIFEGKTSKGASVVVRYPQADDLDEMWHFITTLSAERTFILMQGVEISLQEEAGYLDNALRQIREGKRVQLSVFSGDKLVGNAEITPSVGAKHHVGDFGIAILDGYRGMGIGELLMSLVIEQAQVVFPDMQMISLEVFGNNPIAMSLYRKMGFVEYGRLPRGVKHRDEYVDEVLMVKVL